MHHRANNNQINKNFYSSPPMFQNQQNRGINFPQMHNNINLIASILISN